MGAQTVRAKAARRPYSPEDDQFIEEHFGDWSNRQIAEALGRTESGIRYRAKKMGLSSEVSPIPRARDVGEGGEDRLSKLLRLREIMEGAIIADEVPMMQRPAYYREYRALLKDIDELEGGEHGEQGSDEAKSPFAAALERLAEQQRALLERASES